MTADPEGIAQAEGEFFGKERPAWKGLCHRRAEPPELGDTIFDRVKRLRGAVRHGDNTLLLARMG